MTRDEILNMPAGREMDTLIHAYVIFPHTSHISGYSTDISAAWEVVEKLGYDNIRIEKSGQCWSVYIGGRISAYSNEGIVTLAICRAALLAVMEGEG